MHGFQFDDLIKQLSDVACGRPDKRVGNNTRYSLKDAILSAFGNFYSQSPSFLAYQRQMGQSQGRNNAKSLFGIEAIPSDNQIRNLLDMLNPEPFFEIFRTNLKNLRESGYLQDFSFLGQWLVALDGVEYFSSKSLNCPQCSHRSHKNGTTTYFHSVLASALVCPGKKQIFPLAPEFLTPQVGHEKQDCERAAAQRWIATRGWLATYGVTVLGDDIFCCAPLCQSFRRQGFNFILSCKPLSHPSLYQSLAGLQRLGEISTKTLTRWNGRFKETHHYRFYNGLPLCDSKDALDINWCELTISRQNTGEVLYQNAWATLHRIDTNNVELVVQAARTRWKIENEHNNTLKNQGYHFEHNFGHGQQFLAPFLLTLNLLAFLFHNILALADSLYQKLLQSLGTRQTFFQDFLTLTRYFFFQSWRHLLLFMEAQLQPAQPESS